MTARTVRLDARGLNTLFAVADVLHIDGVPYIPARHSENDSTFHLVLARKDDDVYFARDPRPHGTAYVPPRPGTTPQEVMGAHYAVKTADGMYWQYAHCSPDEQIDFAADARTFALEQYSLHIKKAQVKVEEATRAELRGARVQKVKALIKFAEAVGQDCYDTVVGATLGYYHRNEHHDHRRELALASNDKIAAAWKLAGLTDKAVKDEHDDISSTAAAVKSALSSTHTIEWRHERVARLAAEAKAKEAADESESATQD